MKESSAGSHDSSGKAQVIGTAAIMRLAMIYKALLNVQSYLTEQIMTLSISTEGNQQGDNEMKITREEYMQDSNNLHHGFYSQFVTDGTLNYVKDNIGVERLLKSNCEYFNDIGIKHSRGGAGSWVWDFAPINTQLARELGAVSANCHPSPSTITCIAKAAARILVAEARK